MIKKRLGYLASPYNDPDIAIRDYRVETVCRVAGELISSGIHVFSPIAHNVAVIRALGLPTGWDVWSEFDQNMLSRCDVLIILRLPGWENSKGIAGEIKFADDNGIPVEYIDP